MALAVAVAPAGAWAGTITVVPSFENTSCGTPSNLIATALQCGTPHLGPGLGTLPDNRLVEQRGIVEFAVSGLVGVIGARLDLNLQPRVGFLLGDPTIAFYGYQGNGAIEEADLTAGSLLFSHSSFDPNGGLYQFDVTSFVSLALTGNWSHVGFMLRDTADGSSAFFVQNRLVLTTRDPVPVPEPATVALIGLGVLGIAGRRKAAGARDSRSTRS